MPIDDPNDLDRVDLEIRANELREEARELAGGEMTGYESPDMPLQMAVDFWQRVVDYEKAPLTSHFVKLTEEDGLSLPPPEEMDDAVLTAKLWEVIRALARRQAYITNTNHLSDRELYDELWSEVLHEAHADLPFDPDVTCHIALTSGGSDEDNELYLRYYADDEARRDWIRAFPDYKLPAREAPPYDRDRLLPRAER